MIPLLLLAACLPETYTYRTAMFDLADECWDRDVVVTLETKYWKEWYLETCEDDVSGGGGQRSSVPTSDGRCMETIGCLDKAPLISEDPHFSLAEEDILVCTIKAYRGEGGPYPDCSPAMTEWP